MTLDVTYKSNRSTVQLMDDFGQQCSSTEIENQSPDTTAVALAQLNDLVPKKIKPQRHANEADNLWSAFANVEREYDLQSNQVVPYDRSRYVQNFTNPLKEDQEISVQVIEPGLRRKVTQKDRWRGMTHGNMEKVCRKEDTEVDKGCFSSKDTTKVNPIRDDSVLQEMTPSTCNRCKVSLEQLGYKCSEIECPEKYYLCVDCYERSLLHAKYDQHWYYQRFSSGELMNSKCAEATLQPADSGFDDIETVYCLVALWRKIDGKKQCYRQYRVLNPAFIQVDSEAQFLFVSESKKQLYYFTQDGGGNYHLCILDLKKAMESASREPPLTIDPQRHPLIDKYFQQKEVLTCPRLFKFNEVSCLAIVSQIEFDAKQGFFEKSKTSNIHFINDFRRVEPAFTIPGAKLLLGIHYKTQKVLSEKDDKKKMLVWYLDSSFNIVSEEWRDYPNAVSAERIRRVYEPMPGIGQACSERHEKALKERLKQNETAFMSGTISDEKADSTIAKIMGREIFSFQISEAKQIDSETTWTGRLGQKDTFCIEKMSLTKNTHKDQLKIHGLLSGFQLKGKISQRWVCEIEQSGSMRRLDLEKFKIKMNGSLKGKGTFEGTRFTIAKENEGNVIDQNYQVQFYMDFERQENKSQFMLFKGQINNERTEIRGTYNLNACGQTRPFVMRLQTHLRPCKMTVSVDKECFIKLNGEYDEEQQSISGEFSFSDVAESDKRLAELTDQSMHVGRFQLSAIQCKTRALLVGNIESKNQDKLAFSSQQDYAVSYPVLAYKSFALTNDEIMIVDLVHNLPQKRVSIAPFKLIKFVEAGVSSKKQNQQSDINMLVERDSKAFLMVYKCSPWKTSGIDACETPQLEVHQLYLKKSVIESPDKILKASLMEWHEGKDVCIVMKHAVNRIKVMMSGHGEKELDISDRLLIDIPFQIGPKGQIYAAAKEESGSAIYQITYTDQGFDEQKVYPKSDEKRKIKNFHVSQSLESRGSLRHQIYIKYEDGGYAQLDMVEPKKEREKNEDKPLGQMSEDTELVEQFWEESARLQECASKLKLEFDQSFKTAQIPWIAKNILSVHQGNNYFFLIQQSLSQRRIDFTRHDQVIKHQLLMGDHFVAILLAPVESTKQDGSVENAKQPPPSNSYMLFWQVDHTYFGRLPFDKIKPLSSDRDGGQYFRVKIGQRSKVLKLSKTGEFSLEDDSLEQNCQRVIEKLDPKQWHHHKKWVLCPGQKNFMTKFSFRRSQDFFGKCKAKKQANQQKKIVQIPLLVTIVKAEKRPIHFLVTCDSQVTVTFKSESFKVLFSKDHLVVKIGDRLLYKKTQTILMRAKSVSLNDEWKSTQLDGTRFNFREIDLSGFDSEIYKPNEGFRLCIPNTKSFTKKASKDRLNCYKERLNWCKERVLRRPNREEQQKDDFIQITFPTVAIEWELYRQKQGDFIYNYDMFVDANHHVITDFVLYEHKDDSAKLKKMQASSDKSLFLAPLSKQFFRTFSGRDILDVRALKRSSCAEDSLHNSAEQTLKIQYSTFLATFNGLTFFQLFKEKIEYVDCLQKKLKEDGIAYAPNHKLILKLRWTLVGEPIRQILKETYLKQKANDETKKELLLKMLTSLIYIIRLSSQSRLTDLISDFSCFQEALAFRSPEIHEFISEGFLSPHKHETIQNFGFYPGHDLLTFGSKSNMLSTEEILREFKNERGRKLPSKEKLIVWCRGRCKETKRTEKSFKDTKVKVQVIPVRWVEQDMANFFVYLRGFDFDDLYSNKVVSAMLKSQSYITHLLYVAAANLFYSVHCLWFFSSCLPYEAPPIHGFFGGPGEKGQAYLRCAICFMSIWNLWMELQQMKVQRFLYFFEPWNVLAWFLSLSAFSICIAQSQKEWKRQRLIELVSFSILVQWTMAFYWARLIPNFAFYVNMIIETVKDCAYFVSILIMVIFTFGNAFYVLEGIPLFSDSPEDSGRELAGLAQFEPETQRIWPSFVKNHFMNAAFTNYMIGLGEFHTDGWAEKPSYILLWVYFIITTFFTQILFMNMLIAIMGSTYERVCADKEKATMQERLQLYADWKRFITFSKKFTDCSFLYIISPLDDQDLSEKMDANRSEIQKVQDEISELKEKMQEILQILAKK